MIYLPESGFEQPSPPRAAFNVLILILLWFFLSNFAQLQNSTYISIALFIYFLMAFKYRKLI